VIHVVFLVTALLLSPAIIAHIEATVWQQAVFVLFVLVTVLLGLVILLDVFCLILRTPRSGLPYAYAVLLPGTALAREAKTDFDQLVHKPLILTAIFTYTALCMLTALVAFFVVGIPSP